MPGSTLLDILRIDVILEVLAPHLRFPDVQNLSSINKQARRTLRNNPSSYRRFDLSFDTGTSHQLFQRVVNSNQGLQLLTFARILILDYQDIDIDFLRNLLLGGRHQVRILSIIGCTGLEYDELRSITTLLSHHAELIPAQQRLHGIYLFEYMATKQPWSKSLYPDGKRESSAGTEEVFYSTARCIAPKGWDDQEAAAQISASQGYLMFNAVLCRGPRHDFEHPRSIGARIAGYIIGPEGCSICGTMPEGTPSDLQTQLPLISPPPFHDFLVEMAAKPPYGKDGKASRFFARCRQCIKRSFCTSCGRFFCEDCNETEGGPIARIDWPGGAHARFCDFCKDKCVACRRDGYVLCQDCDMYFCKVDVGYERQTLVDSVRGLEEMDNIELCDYCTFNRADDLHAQASD